MFKSLKTKVVVSFIFLVIIPVIAGAVIILMQIKASHINSLDIIHTQMTKRVASEFENYVNFNLKNLSRNEELQSLPLSSPEFIREKLTAKIMFNNNLSQIMLLNSEGKLVSHVHRYKIANYIEQRSFENRLEYLFPKLNRDTFFGEVKFNEETGEPVMNVSFDIRDPKTDALNGVFVFSLRLKPIWNMLADIAVQPGQYVYILDSSGRLVAHPDPSAVLKNLTYKTPDTSIAQGLLGNEVFIKYTKINFGNIFFTIISEHSTKEAFKLIRSVSIVIIVVVSFTLLMSFMLIGFNIRYIVNPINHLSKVAQEIESGDLKKRAQVFSDDEIGDMAQAFNKMTAKLQDNTRQLQEFNTGLQKKIKKEIEKTRRMEQLLFEQKKFADMGQMINAIAHQWRQPLNNIGLIQQFLCEGFFQGDITANEYREYSGTLLEIVQDMSETIDDFRTFFTANKVNENFNVIGAMKDLLKLTSAQLTSHNIKYSIKCYGCENNHVFDANSLDMACGNRKLNILGHPGEFKQVLQNIVANAKDALISSEVEDPKITILVRLAGDEIIITFRDNAGGIPEEILPNIFDPYFTTKEEGKGTGIGLYISKVIIEEHFKGRLYAENNRDGADFVVQITGSGENISL